MKPTRLTSLWNYSTKAGELVNLSMESKDGKAWTPSSTPSWPAPQRRKTPSHWRRDQRRREQFLNKKMASDPSLDIKKENSDKGNVAKVTLEIPSDEIDLIKIPDISETRPIESDVFKIKGEYKNPKFKPWEVVDPKKESKTLWDMLEVDNKIKGIEEIGDGSTCFEHCLEFWGTWKVNKLGVDKNFLNNSSNWPNGVSILEVKPA